MRRNTPLFRKKNVKKQDRRRRFRFLFRALLGLLLLSGLGWGAQALLTHLSLFSLKRIAVLGNPKTLSIPKIIDRTQAKLGTNIFQVDLKGVRSRLGNYDFFKKVIVRRRLPGTLVVEVQEYTPEFILYTGRMYYVDSEGKIFRDITDGNDKRDFPVLSGITEDEILSQPGEVQEIIKDAFQLKQAYLGTEFSERYGLSEVHYEKNFGFILYPEKEKYSIKFGNSEFGDKVKMLSRVLDRLKNSEIHFSSIDLNYPGKVLMTL